MRLWMGEGLVALGVTWVISSGALAQGINSNAKVLNGIGRFLGVGYSQGYHANHHPGHGWGLMHDRRTKPYIDPSLTAIYAPGYQSAYGNGWHQPGSPLDQMQGTGDGFRSILQPNSMLPNNTSGPSASIHGAQGSIVPDGSPSDKPVSPPPVWLEKYLPKNTPAEKLKTEIPELEIKQPTAPRASPQPTAPKIEKAEEPLPLPTKLPGKQVEEDDDLLGPESNSDDDLLAPSDSARSQFGGNSNRNRATTRLSPSPYRYRIAAPQPRTVVYPTQPRY